MLQDRNLFIHGFSLLNRNIDLYLIAVLFTLFLFFIHFLNKLPFPFGLINGILLVIVTVLSLSYGLLVPLLLSYNQQRMKISYQTLLKLIVGNAKRLLIPFIILIPILFIVSTIIGAVLIITLHIKNSQQLIQTLDTIQPSWNPGYFLFTSILTVLLSFLTFTSVFFSVENLGIFSAWVKSITFSFRNIRFIGLIIVISLATNFVSSVINLIPFDRAFVTYISSIPIQYIHLGVLSSSLLYYQHERDKNLDKT